MTAYSGDKNIYIYIFGVKTQAPEPEVPQKVGDREGTEI